MQTSRTTHFIAAIGAVVLAVGVHAQQPLFRDGVEIVPLTVTVTEPGGKHLSGLAATDFSVFEDGQPQALTFFTRDRVATDLALVLDISGSMFEQIAIVKRAATELVQSLQTGDRASVVAIKRYVAVPQPLTEDRGKVMDAINRLSTSGETSFYDGVYIALKDLARAREKDALRKQVMVVVSDGLDTSSHVRFEDISTLAVSMGVNVYVIAVPAQAWADDRDMLRRAQFELRVLGRDTGGRTFTPHMIDELPGVSAAIIHELANQYELAYVPQRSAPTRGFRRVTVRVANAIARTRAGYFASVR